MLRVSVDGGDVAYPHHLGSARQDPVEEKGVQIQSPKLDDELVGDNGVEHFAVVSEQLSHIDKRNT